MKSKSIWKNIFTSAICISIIILICVGCNTLLNDTTSNVICDWCGEREDCRLYSVQTLDGFNRDGSFKYAYDYLNFSDKCYQDAKDNGGKYGWLNIIKVD